MKEDLVAAVSNMKEQEALNLVQEMLDNGEYPQNILDACNEAMSIVGTNYEQGIYFLPELIMSGEILKQITDLIKPKMATSSSGEKAVLGTVVLGTVKNDIHDIGKDIVVTLLQAGGYKVVDLGVDVPPVKFVEAVKDSGATVVGLSGLLTISFDSMKETVDALKEAGLPVKVMVGGGPVTEQVCNYVGADALGADAQAAVTLCDQWITAKEVM